MRFTYFYITIYLVTPTMNSQSPNKIWYSYGLLNQIDILSHAIYIHLAI